jgi:hypothetical protein
VHRINFEKLLHLKIISFRQLQFTKLSKGVSKIVLKFPHEVIFRTRNYGTLLLAFLFLRNDLLEIPVDLVSCRKSRRPRSSSSFPASQVKSVEIEVFLSSQGSRIVNMKKSSTVYSFLVRAHNLQILRSEQGSTPRIDQSFLATLLFVAIANIKRCTLRFLFLLPIAISSLDRWTSSVSVSRPYDAVTPSFPQPYSRRRNLTS